jgi:hypothetical protein
MTRTMWIALVAAVAAVPASHAALTVATDAAAPALRVDAAGNAEISWTSGGRRMTALVPRTGRMVAGGQLAGADVSRALAGSQIPFQRAIRTGPGGWYYALQAWRPTPGGPLELRFSRWQGVPTEVSLTPSQTTGGGIRLTGRATLDEKPLRAAPGLRVYLDSLAGTAWSRLGSARLGPGGSYAWRVPSGQAADSFRATVTGPNLGATLAPDASMVAPAPFQLDPVR